MATAKDNLDRQIGRDNADAIEAFVDEKLGQNSEQLEGIREELAGLRQQIDNLPEDLQRQLKAASKLLSGVIDDHNELVDRRNAGEPVSEREVAEDDAQVKRVTTDVKSVRDELEERVDAIEARLDDKDTGLEALSRRDDDLQGQIDEIRSAQSTVVTSSGSKSGLKAALITFAVVFVIAWVWIMLTGEDESWVWAAAWGGILGGLVGVLVGIASTEGTRTNTYMGDLRDFRRSRQEERQGSQEQEKGATASSTESSRTRVVEKKEKVSA